MEEKAQGSRTQSKRPRSVTLIAWYTIGNSLLHAAMFPELINTSVGRKVLHAVGIPLSVAIGWTLASSLTHVIAGVAMLRQRNWGRLLYLSFVPMALALTMALYGVQLYDVLAIVMYGCFFIVLMRPSVAAFFRDKTAALSNSQDTD